jgi:hypothetical protein
MNPYLQKVETLNRKFSQLNIAMRRCVTLRWEGGIDSIVALRVPNGFFPISPSFACLIPSSTALSKNRTSCNPKRETSK